MQDAGQHQVVGDADEDEHHARHQGHGAHGHQNREAHQRAERREHQVHEHGLCARTLLQLEPAEHDDRHVQHHIGGQRAEVRDLHHGVHVDAAEMEEQRQHHGQGDDEDDGVQRRVRALVHLGHELRQAAAIGHGEHDEGDGVLLRDSGEHALGQRHAHGAHDHEPGTGGHLGHGVERVVSVAGKGRARRIDARGDEALQRVQHAQHDGHDHHGARRPVLGILRLLGQRGDGAEAHVGHHGQRHSGHGAAELELGGVEQVGRREIRALGMLHDEHHAAHDEQRENRQLGYQRHLVHHHGGLHADKRHDGHNNEEPEANRECTLRKR